jgi:hypothetical protein
MQVGHDHPENQGAFQPGTLPSVDISTFDRIPRVTEPRTREIYRGLLRERCLLFLQSLS